MGCAEFTAAEFGGRGDYRVAEYAAECATEGLGRFAERAHGGGNDAAGVRGSRRISCRSGLFERAGGGIDELVLCEGSGSDDRCAARVIEQRGEGGDAACLRSFGGDTESAGNGCGNERWAAYDAFFRGGCGGECGGEHVHVERQLWIACDVLGGISVER